MQKSIVYDVLSAQAPPECAMTETMTLPAFEVHLPALPMSKGEREYQAFRRLLPALLATHAGKFVAVHEEKVVDSDTDDIALVQRVHANVGYVPIFVGFVADAQPLVRIPHYRECH
jgi:hypothetical protein